MKSSRPLNRTSWTARGHHTRIFFDKYMHCFPRVGVCACTDRSHFTEETRASSDFGICGVEGPGTKLLWVLRDNLSFGVTM